MTDNNRLNQRRLVNLRLSRGVAVRQAARDCGIEIAVLNRLEAIHDPSLSNISVGALVRLANYLAVPIGHLFTEDSPHDTHAPEVDPSDDPPLLGALLATLPGETATVAIADALNWDITRVHTAADTLDNDLRQLGMTIYRTSGLISVRPIDDRADQAALAVRRHRRAKPNQRLLTPARARILHRASQKPISQHSISKSDRANIATLVKAGLLEEDDRRHLVPSPDVLTSVYNI